MVCVTLICAADLLLTWHIIYLITEYIAYTPGQSDTIFLYMFTINEIIFFHKCSVNNEICWNRQHNCDKYIIRPREANDKQSNFQKTLFVFCYMLYVWKQERVTVLEGGLQWKPSCKALPMYDLFKVICQCFRLLSVHVCVCFKVEVPCSIATHIAWLWLSQQ